ncbi:hypothetical protein Zmor_018683 [Zophobas morio]|uniref:Protein CUSTOS n=1 Tax=Zophobas morio TaxID=2755281 RepID=A0AA38MDA5_9CUCU|nr:hypothetical protein Zmor_018683 [Zophobas morio]
MSSDSSDDEDLMKLREATDSQFINDSMFNQKPGKVNVKEQIERPQSLRYSKDEDEQFNLFRVSPEFRNYVAKHLSSLLDKVLEKQLTSDSSVCDGSIKPKRRKSGVKLFRNSPHYIKVKTKDVSGDDTLVRRTIVAKSDVDPVSDEQLRLIAVNPEDILSQKDVKCWSTRTKAPVYNYVKTKSGLMLK